MERTLSDRTSSVRTARTPDELLSVYDSGLPVTDKPTTQFSNYLLFLLAMAALIFVIIALLVLATRSKFTTTTATVFIYAALIVAGFALVSISLCADKFRTNLILGMVIVLMLAILLWFIVSTLVSATFGLALGILLLVLSLVFIYMVQGSINILIALPLIILPIVAIFANWYSR